MPIRIRCFLTSFLFAWIHLAVSATSSPDAEAAAFFQQGKYDEALELWNKSLLEGNQTAGIYYNLGLTASRLHRSPDALLAFEKAKRLKPYSEQIQLAITEERSRIPGAVVPAKPFFLTQWYIQFLGRLRPGVWALLGLLLLAGIVFYSFGPGKDHASESTGKTITRIGFTIGLFMLLVGFLDYREMYRRDEAILMQGCALKQAPDNGSPSVNELPAGEKVMISDSLSGWYRVRLLNFEEGWVEAGCTALIIP